MVFSVIIPTCNRNDLLVKCLDALHPEKQNFLLQNYEVIVTDDSKTNNAKEIINYHYPWTKWIKGPKRGPAANRNNGAKHSNGKWLIFLDDDCIPSEKLLETYYRHALEANFDVLEGRIFTEDRIPKWNEIAPVNEKGGYLWTCNLCLKRETFCNINGFDENFKYPNLEDVDLHKRLLNANVKIKFLKDASVFHPLRKVSSPKTKSKHHESWLYFQKKHYNKKGIFSIFQLFITILKFKLYHIYRNKSDFHSIISISIDTILETVFTMFNPKIWKQKI